MDKNSVLLTSLKKVATDNAKRIAAVETEKLRQNAMNAGWPSDVVSQISIVFDKDKLHVDYPDSVKGSILDLEYGTPSAPPSPVIRTSLLGAN